MSSKVIKNLLAAQYPVPTSNPIQMERNIGQAKGKKLFFEQIIHKIRREFLRIYPTNIVDQLDK